jgi:hypothetical protein
VSGEAAMRLRRITELFGLNEEGRSDATPFDSHAKAS